MRRMIFAMMILSLCACKSENSNNQDSAASAIDSVATTVVDSISTTDTNTAEADNSAELLKSQLSPKVDKMLLVSENAINYRFSNDSRLKSKDPHTFWLVNHMMQMVATIESADDDLAWAIAVDKCVGVYNSRHGKKQLSTLDAMQAIEKLMEEYAAGSQADMNAASDVSATVTHFATTYEYCKLIGLVESDSKAIGMSDLYYNEFCQWWKIKEATNSLMSHLTYAAANYSMAPLEMATYIDNCYKNRQSELKSEKQLIATENWKSFKSELTDITAQKHDNLVNFFKSINTQHVADLFDAEVFGRDYAIEMAEEYFDLDKITKAGNQYASALSEWRSVREQIAQSLPEEKRESYREMTKQTHARLYKNLLELKTVKR